MPVTFDMLPPCPTRPVILRGKPFNVRALSSSESFRLRTRAILRPAPPPVKNPTKGSLTDEIVLADWDADYRREMAAYVWRVAILTAAVAVDFQTSAGEFRRGMNDGELAAWAEKAIDELSAALNDEEVRAINAASDAAGAAALEDAEKN